MERDPPAPANITHRGEETRLAFRGSDLRKIYRSGETEAHALRGIDLAIPQGELQVFLAPLRQWQVHPGRYGRRAGPTDIGHVVLSGYRIVRPERPRAYPLRAGACRLLPVIQPDPQLQQRVQAILKRTDPGQRLNLALIVGMLRLPNRKTAHDG
jgi:hypothetical protein